MKKTEIIAEIAQGYEGKPNLLKKLTKQASSLKIDGIKYQLVYADELATPDYKYFKLFRQLELDEKYWNEVCKILKKKNIKLYFDIFGEKSLQIAKKLGAHGVKLSTTEFYNSELILKSLKKFKVVILSVAGIPFDEIKKLERLVLKKYKKKLILIYGFQSEPTQIYENNFLKLKALKDNFKDYSFGFMDHSHGGKKEALYTSLLALSCGVKLIEKHFTLNRKEKIEDYISGLSKNDFKKFIEIIRFYEQSLGKYSLKLSDSEKAYSSKALKVVVAKRDILKNKLLKKKDLSLKRSGYKSKKNNLFNKIQTVIGKKTKTIIKKNQPILKKNLI